MDLDDTHSGSRYALGEYYWELEDYSKSLVYYSKAIEIDSELDWQIAEFLHGKKNHII